nr:NADH dehydrogenase subunit 5 [Henestaris halophilus]
MIFYLYMFWSILFLLFGVLLLFMGIYFISIDYIYLMDWEIISFHSCSVVMTLLFDSMSLLFMGSVLFISSMVIFYSYSYMLGDDYIVRFLYLVVLFVFSMCFMILSPNLISILLGWDGLGLVSYALVIYFNNYKSYNAGMLTILTNRVGDVLILLGIGMFFSLGSWYFIFYFTLNYWWMYYFMLMMVLASFTSSAQIPFSSWLPAAMAAPTPVSALVHSSTLVTAGVYLMIRFSFYFYSYDLSFFLVLSILTMFMSGLGACYEYDLKKIIALSTLSQLGLMMSILFIGYPMVSFFHLLSHAFFKALLFMCAGLIIHCMNNTQDIRFMGGMVNNIPYTSSCFGVANMSLCGLPFLSGFYSSDMIMEVISFNSFNLFIYTVLYLSVGLTAYYSVRLLYYSMFNYLGTSVMSVYFEDIYMLLSNLFLMVLGVAFGGLMSWLIFSYPVFIMLPLSLKLAPLFIMFAGFYLGYELSLFYYSSMPMNIYLMSYFLGSMWFIPYFSTLALNFKLLSISVSYIKFIDYAWGEYLISRLLSYLFIMLSKFNIYYQYNSIKLFFLIFMIFSFFLVL